MRLESLRLKGFVGILKGLGLEEISIDFRGIEGLAALDGMNGSGKTTVLENLHPFNCLASREGALYQHCYLRSSEKEFSFTYAGSLYRTLLKIDAQSGKSEGYLWKNGEPQVNGKISAYAAYVRDLLGSPSLFFSSVFCAQGSKKINELTTGKLKELFAEFLRLHRYQEWEQTAKQAANLLTDRSQQLDARLAGLRERVADKDEIHAATLAATESLYKLTDDLESLRRGLQHANTGAEEIRQRIARQAVTVQRRADLESTIARMEADATTEGQAVEAGLAELRAKYEDLSRQIRDLDAVLVDREAVLGAAGQEKELTARIETLAAVVETLQAQATAQQEALSVIEEEIRGLESWDNALLCDEELATICERIRELKGACEEHGRQIAAHRTDLELDRLKRHVITLQERTQDFERMDERCTSQTCSFLFSARRAANELPAAQREADDRAKLIDRLVRDHERERDAALADLKKEEGKRDARAELLFSERQKVAAEKAQKCEAKKAARLALTETTDALSGVRKALATARFDVGKVRDLAARAPEIQVAEARRRDLAGHLRDVAKQGLDAGKAWNIRKAALDDAIDDERVKLATIVAEIVPGLEAVLLGQNSVISRITDNISEAEKEQDEIRGRIITLQADLGRAVEAQAEMDDLTAKKGRLLNDASEWRYLQDRCGKNGLQALEIDGAAPLITSFANDLLARAFGPLFSVRFRTQDDEGRECLDIIVIGEDGGEVLLDNLSGGQKVWVLMALRLAMTLLSAEKSGRNFETAFFDEMDGALDPDNAVNFIAMYRAFAEIGGFKTVLYISHKPECRGMADNILKFEAGKVPAWV